MVEVKFFDYVDDKLLKFAVIISKAKGKWVFCKHKDRDTYEVPGGHREKEELIFDTANRELREEIVLLDNLVENWTYPLIQPKLIEEAQRRGFL